MRAVDETRQVELQAIVSEQRRQTQRRHLLHGTAQAQQLDQPFITRNNGKNTVANTATVNIQGMYQYVKAENHRPKSLS